jgi:catechol 2,3-dioxygenase
VPDIVAASTFYADMGFRIIDYMVVAGEPVGVFLHVKETPYDVVFIRRPGPALHHFGYIVNGIHDIIKACDVAGSLGLGECVEFGPGRHSLGHSYYVYLLDPDGHRIELLPPPVYFGDADEGPIVHDLTGRAHVTESWGLPPRLNWLKVSDLQRASRSVRQRVNVARRAAAWPVILMPLLEQTALP